MKRGDERFSPEKGRYHLFASPACPWSHQVLIVISLKGLKETIPVTITKPISEASDNPADDDHLNWVFEDSKIPDFRTAKDIYQKSFCGEYTLPVLFDSKLNHIVNNCSFDIIRMLASEFDDYATNPGLDLYPTSLRTEIDDVHKWIYPSFTNGVYLTGMATNQNDYLTSVKEVTSSFDRIEDMLKDNKFLVGKTMTIIDICLFVTLLRFDEIYAVRFLVNTRSVASSVVLLRYCRDVYLPEVAETCDMDQIKTFYYCNDILPKKKDSIIPMGPGFVDFLLL